MGRCGEGPGAKTLSGPSLHQSVYSFTPHRVVTSSLPSHRIPPCHLIMPKAERNDIEVRALRTHEEYRACVRLQHETWGEQFSDIVPASILMVSQKIGGVTAGAFSGAELVGFVFGMTGLREGRLVHWSDMLAVRPSYQNRGVGRLLKQHQREVVHARGVEVMHWTFDPLVARNAHFNLNGLGADASEYLVDMYGAATGSALHATGTDRFVVSWNVVDPPALRVFDAAWPAAPVASAATDSAVQRIEIPADITRVPLEEAQRWRQATRAAFTTLLARGYQVRGFYTDGDRAWYVLARC
jgi:chorismate synthase